MDLITDKLSGTTFCVMIGTDYAKNILKNGLPHYNLIQWCKNLISKDKNFIDIGANVGAYSIMLSKHCKQVYAFEPQRRIFDCLTVSTKLNKSNNVNLYNMGLGKGLYYDHIHISSDYISSSFNPDKIIKRELHTEQCKIVNLDMFDIKDVGLIKINTNGLELNILKGARKCLEKNNLPHVLLITTDYHAVNYLKIIGYEVCKLDTYDNAYFAYNSKNIKMIPVPAAEGEISWEHWYKLSEKHTSQRENALAYKYAIKAVDTGVPFDDLYKIYKEISINAYYIGKLDEGFEACEKILLTYQVPWNVRNFTMSNMQYYIKSLPMKQKIKLDHDKPSGYQTTSSSIIQTENGFRTNVRCVDYTIRPDGSYCCASNDHVIRTQNILLDLTKEFAIENNVRYLVDKSGITLYPKNILGMEDVRLFGDNYLFCTYLEMNETRTPQIGWGTYDPDGTVTRMVPLQVTPQLQCEKNWMPFINNDEIYFIYSIGPFVLYKLNKNTAEITEIKRCTFGNSTGFLDWNDVHINDFRGSAPPIPYKDGWLCTIHQVVYQKPRKYFHRFVWFDKDFTILKFSKPFYFSKIGIEFNLSICHSDDGLLVPYSINDSDSTIGIIDYHVLDSCLQHVTLSSYRSV